MPVQVERTNVSLPSGARLMILRDNIDHMEPAKMATVDCSHFAQYARSAKLARTILLHCHPCIVCDLLLACVRRRCCTALCELARWRAQRRVVRLRWRSGWLCQPSRRLFSMRISTVRISALHTLTDRPFPSTGLSHPRADTPERTRLLCLARPGLHRGRL